MKPFTSNLVGSIKQKSTSAFVDASAWVAFFKEDDIHHERATRLLYELIDANTLLLTSNMVVYEALTVLSMRSGKQAGIKFGNWYYTIGVKSEVVQCIFVDDSIEHKTWQLFQTVSKKDISFVDCLSVIIAIENGIRQVVTFDRHFKQFEKEFSIKIIN